MSRFPSITGLCRCNKLVSPAQEGDCIVYVTVRHAGERRLVAVLQVLHKLENHAQAADWYRRNRLPLPTNCVVPGNPPLPLARAGQAANDLTYQEWANAYHWRAAQYPSFLVCRAIHGPELHKPPVVPDNLLGRAFPNTRSPKLLSEREFRTLCRLLK
jgi:hypothetical protein